MKVHIWWELNIIKVHMLRVELNLMKMHMLRVELNESAHMVRVEHN